jgi:beta-glucosidase
MTAGPSSDRSPTSFDFTWGVSTSAYQIEGAVNEDGRGPSIWDLYSRLPGKIAGGDTGDIACDHYHRYREDVVLMQKLGIDAYRFSVAWPRVMPEGRGAINEAGLAFYDRLIDSLIGSGIEPWLCLYHWDLPQALQDEGGWTNRDCAQWFADYASVVARRYGDRVKRFATFNEPSVFTLFGYCLGGQAPGIVDRAMLLRAIHHVNLGHGAAVDRLRATVTGASLGAVHNCQPCRPATDKPEDRAASDMLDAYWNGAFPDPQLRGVYPPLLSEAMAPYVKPGDLAQINRPVDWFGLNFAALCGGERPQSARPVVWFGASRCAALLHGLAGRAGCVPRNPHHHAQALRLGDLRDGKRHCQCGQAHAQRRGARRAAHFLSQSLTDAMFDAIADGVDVRGYFVWSLLDNFEWGSGYSQRFGLVYMDYPTLRRLPKDSFHWFGDLIKAHSAWSVPTV